MSRFILLNIISLDYNYWCTNVVMALMLQLVMKELILTPYALFYTQVYTCLLLKLIN